MGWLAELPGSWVQTSICKLTQNHKSDLIFVDQEIGRGSTAHRPEIRIQALSNFQTDVLDAAALKGDMEASLWFCPSWTQLRWLPLRDDHAGCGQRTWGSSPSFDAVSGAVVTGIHFKTDPLGDGVIIKSCAATDQLGSLPNSEWFRSCCRINRAILPKSGNRLPKQRRPLPVRDDFSMPALRAYLKLYRATSTITARLALTLARDCGLTMTQFNILENLYSQGEIRQQELGRKILKSDGNITFVLVNLEKMGLLQRTRAEGTRRDLIVSITDEGRQKIEHAFPIFSEVVSAAMSVLSVDELESFGNMCKRIGLGLHGQNGIDET